MDRDGRLRQAAPRARRGGGDIVRRWIDADPDLQRSHFWLPAGLAHLGRLAKPPLRFKRDEASIRNSPSRLTAPPRRATIRPISRKANKSMTACASQDLPSDDRPLRVPSCEKSFSCGQVQLENPFGSLTISAPTRRDGSISPLQSTFLSSDRPGKLCCDTRRNLFASAVNPPKYRIISLARRAGEVEVSMRRAPLGRSR